MNKHYRDFSTTQDKIIHILYAGYVCDYYTEAKKECEEQFGKKELMHAEKEFMEKFKPNWR